MLRGSLLSEARDCSESKTNVSKVRKPTLDLGAREMAGMLL